MSLCKTKVSQGIQTRPRSIQYFFETKFPFFQSKVIRVLNLWQKNEVFTSDVIQPLFDLANPNSELAKQMDDQSKRGLLGNADGPSSVEKPAKAPKIQIAPETQTQNRQPPPQQQPEDQVGFLSLKVFYRLLIDPS